MRGEAGEEPPSVSDRDGVRGSARRRLRPCSRTRGGDRLAVDVILDVAAGEDAGDVRLGAVVGDQVAVASISSWPVNN